MRERIPPREDASPEGQPSVQPPSSPSKQASTSTTETPTSIAEAPTSNPENGAEPERFWDYEDDDDDDEDDPDIPPALIRASEYDAFICGECVVGNPMLRKWAGTPGVRMVIRHGKESSWIVYGDDETTEEDPSGATSVGEVGQKRTRDQMEGTSSEENRPSKKPKLGAPPSGCTAPTPDPPIQTLLDRIAKGGPYVDGDGLQGGGDIFFTPGWRQRWCRCKDVSRRPLAAGR